MSSHHYRRVVRLLEDGKVEDAKTLHNQHVQDERATARSLGVPFTPEQLQDLHQAKDAIGRAEARARVLAQRPHTAA